MRLNSQTHQKEWKDKDAFILLRDTIQAPPALNKTQYID